MQTLRSLVVFGLAAVAGEAQCFEPNFQQPIASASLLVGDVLLPLGATGVPIGFPFPLGGTTYSDLHVADKGYVLFSNAGVPAPPSSVDLTATAAELFVGPPAVAALWCDLQVLATANGMIYVDSSPQRCVITWQNIACFNDSCAPFTMQMQLFPNGQIWCFYDRGATNNSDPFVAAWQAGVVGVSPGAATTSSAADLSAGGTVTTAALAEEWPLANTFDMAGRGLAMIPTGSGWTFFQPTGCAEARAYGDGCVRISDSVCELFDQGFDLSNTTITWVRTSSGYLVTTGLPSPFVPPTAAAQTVAAGQLDGEQFFQLPQPMQIGSTFATGFNVTTKGMVEVAQAPTGNIDWTPAASELYDWPTTVFACWRNYDQRLFGSITFEAMAGTVYVTWNAVQSLTLGGPSTFQFQFELASGTVRLVFGAMAPATAGDKVVVGYSPFGGSADVDPVDFSQPGFSSVIEDVGKKPLLLNAGGLPRLGTTFQFEISGVGVLPLAVLGFGDTAIEPGIDLSSIGMAGCHAYSNVNLGSLTVPTTAGSASVPLVIPNVPAFVGYAFTSQVLALSVQTSLNVVSSNGLAVVVGN